MPEIINLTSNNYNDYIYGRKINNVIYYGSKYCIKCSKYKNEFENFVNSKLIELNDTVNFYFFDTNHKIEKHNSNLYDFKLMNQSIISFLKGAREIKHITNNFITFNNILENIDRLLNTKL